MAGIRPTASKTISNKLQKYPNEKKTCIAFFPFLLISVPKIPKTSGHVEGAPRRYGRARPPRLCDDLGGAPGGLGECGEPRAAAGGGLGEGG